MNHRTLTLGSVALLSLVSACGSSSHAPYAGMAYASPSGGSARPAEISMATSESEYRGPAASVTSAPEAAARADLDGVSDRFGGVAPVAAAPMSPPPTGASTSTPVANGGEMAPMDSRVTITTTTTVTAVPTPMQVAPVVMQQNNMAGRLTAASVGDHDRRDAYLEYLGRHSGERSMLRLNLTRRVRFRVVDGQGQAVNNAVIALRAQGASVDGRTHADGIWDFFPGLYGEQVGGQMSVQITSPAGATQASVSVPFSGDGQEVTVRMNGAAPSAPRALDLAFTIDVTGSMGDELAYVHHEIAHIVERVRASVPNTNVRVAATFYRDRSDPVVVQQIPFTSNIAGFASMMGGVQASGGGDYPEDMNTGLDAAFNRLQWSDDNSVRVMVLIADAPPQHYGDAQFTYRHAMQMAGARGIRLLPVAASGADRSVEYLFRAMGAVTSTPYTYLTDESGVGHAHMEADTDRVAVERFNDLLTRLIVSDLRGQGMHELIRE